MLMRRGLGRLAGLLIAALALQVGLGISNVVFNLPLAVAVAHNGGGAALLLVLVLVNYRLRQPAHATRQTEPASISNTTGSSICPALDPQGEPHGDPTQRTRRPGQLARLPELTAEGGTADAHHPLVGMFLATRAGVPWTVLLFGNLGIALCAGGAAAVNHVVDRQIDSVMARTHKRPLAEGRVSPAAASDLRLVLSASAGWPCC